MNSKLLAIASLCAFSLAACESTGKANSTLADTYRLHTPDGVIETSDPAIIAQYRSQTETTIVLLGTERTKNASLRMIPSEPSAP